MQRGRTNGDLGHHRLIIDHPSHYSGHLGFWCGNLIFGSDFLHLDTARYKFGSWYLIYFSRHPGQRTDTNSSLQRTTWDNFHNMLQRYASVKHSALSPHWVHQSFCTILKVETMEICALNQVAQSLRLKGSDARITYLPETEVAQ